MRKRKRSVIKFNYDGFITSIFHTAGIHIIADSDADSIISKHKYVYDDLDYFPSFKNIRFRPWLINQNKMSNNKYCSDHTLSSYCDMNRQKSYLRRNAYKGVRLSSIVQQSTKVAISSGNSNFLVGYKITKKKKEYISMDTTIYKNLVNKLIDKGTKTAMDYTINIVKNHFGKEFIFSYESDRDVIQVIINEFIAKYDKKIDIRGQKNIQEQYEFKNVEYILPLSTRKDTFIYVASGNKIATFEERFIGDRISENDLKFYIFGKKSKSFIREVEKLIDKTRMNTGELGIYDISSGVSEDERGHRHKSQGLHIVYNTMRPRSLDTMFFSNNEKEQIVDHLEKFKNNYEFYHDRQLSYKTGILLYGEPGTGKSSLVKAIATTFKRSILNVSIADFEYIDINKLVQAINTDTDEEYIVLLEDIDTLFLNRDESVDKEMRKVINKLLQFLDSNSSPSNVIFIATTNHLDRLDNALLRAGRFDIKVEICPLNYHDVLSYGKSFGLNEFTINNICKELCSRVSHENNLSTTEQVYNQSSLQIKFISSITNKSSDDIAKIYGYNEKK